MDAAQILQLLLSEQGKFLGGGVAIIMIVLFVRRQFAADSMAIAREQQQSDLYKQMAEQLDNAHDVLDKVTAERNALHGEVGALRATVASHERTIRQQDKRIKTLERNLGIHSDFGELDDGKGA